MSSPSAKCVINKRLCVPQDEFQFTAIRAQGSGGQNVNKVSSAIHLRFDVRSSSLPEWAKQRLLQFQDQRITVDGVVVIKAQKFRTRERNRLDAMDRFRDLVNEATRVQKKRVPTRPSRAAKTRRLDMKKRRSELKKLRSKDID